MRYACVNSDVCRKGRMAWHDAIRGANVMGSFSSTVKEFILSQ
jgi:hypothetical protein